MAESDLIQGLGELDAPATPSSEFAAMLWGQLTAEMDSPSVPAVVARGAVPGDASRLRASRTRRLAVMAASFVAVIAVGGILAWLIPRGDEVEATPRTPSTSPAPTVPSTTGAPTTVASRPPAVDLPAIVAFDEIVLPTGYFPYDVASDGVQLWVLATLEPRQPLQPQNGEAVLLSLDPETGEVGATISLATAPLFVVADADGVWVVYRRRGEVARLDPSTGAVVATLALELPDGMAEDGGGFVASHMAIGHGAVWVLTERGALAKIDIDSVRVVGVVALEPGAPNDLAVGVDAVWIAEDQIGVTKVDPVTLETETFPLDGRTLRVAEYGDVYVGGRRTVTRMDRVTGEPLGTADFRRPITYLGWVEASFGAMDIDGSFWHLGPSPTLTEGGSATNWVNAHYRVGLGRDTVMVDDTGGRIVAMRETGPAPTDFTLRVGPLINRVDGPGAPSADWVELDPGPLGPARALVEAWTGTEFILWGIQDRFDGPIDPVGAAYDPASGRWREVASFPPELTALIFDPLASVWTGEELLIWDQSDGIAYRPDTDTWRVIEDWPQFIAASSRMIYLWDGEEVLDFKGNRAVSPIDGAVRDIAAPDFIHERATAVWTGDVAVVVTSNGVYDPQADTWTSMPASGLTPLSVAGGWTGERVLAIDYLQHAAAFDPDTNAWERLPELPVRGGECGSALYVIREDVGVVGEHVAASLCAELVLWDTGRAGWVPVAFPKQWQSNVIGSDGSTLYVRDAETGAFHRLDPAVLEPGSTPSRLAVGIGALDVPDGWRLIAATAVDERHRFDMSGPGGEECVISAGYADANAVIASYVASGATIDDITRVFDGAAISVMVVPNEGIDDDYHVVVVQGTSDVIDVACGDEATTRFLAGHLWN